MAGHLDDAMKKLIGLSPQDFLQWVEPEAELESILSEQLKATHIYADALIRARMDGEPVLVDVEVQSTNDDRMGERLLEYSILASREHDYLSVYSCVIYLRDDGEVPISPFIRRLPNGKEVIVFHYKVIELAKLTAEELIATGLVGLLPLLPSHLREMALDRKSWT
jgi:hypothetical protein